MESCGVSATLTVHGPHCGVKRKLGLEFERAGGGCGGGLYSIWLCGKDGTAERSIFISSTSIELVIDGGEDGEDVFEEGSPGVELADCWAKKAESVTDGSRLLSPPVVMRTGWSSSSEKMAGERGRVSREPKPRTLNFFFGIGEEGVVVVATGDELRTLGTMFLRRSGRRWEEERDGQWKAESRVKDCCMG